MPALNELPVLLYHHVGPPRPGTRRSLTVDPARFRTHLRWLGRLRRQPVDLDEVVAWATEGRPLPSRSVLITFDDAYADLAEWAFPALAAAGFPATVFVVTGLIGATNAWDRAVGETAHPLLGEEALRAFSGKGIDFGAHTRTHPDLSRLDEGAARGEIGGSRRDLEALVGRPVRAFAYPYGEPGQAERRLASEEFDVAFTTLAGRNRGGLDRFAIRRTMVQSYDTPLDLAQRLALGRSPTSLARQELGRARRRVKGTQPASTRS